jgi:transcriptional regulator GlxA family with amidase domain
VEPRGTSHGSATAVNRLCDALFVYVLRSHLAALPTPESNWLRALDEPQIGAALGLLHEEPGRSWSVPMLAASVGMSRSAFAARFTKLVGQPPMRYLTHWRLQKAAAMLRADNTSTDEIASHLGYQSTIAFSKASSDRSGSHRVRTAGRRTPPIATPPTERRSTPLRAHPAGSRSEKVPPIRRVRSARSSGGPTTS